ncbi:MAG: hypothetical protein O4859_26215 [Trichodesmium sp. St18_bin1]|nr:hypothetical protein [Trichodesmium sp. St18_bin1]
MRLSNSQTVLKPHLTGGDTKKNWHRVLSLSGKQRSLPLAYHSRIIDYLSQNRSFFCLSILRLCKFKE